MPGCCHRRMGEYSSETDERANPSPGVRIALIHDRPASAQRPDDVFLHGAFRNAQALRDLLVTALVEPVEEEDFAAAGRQCPKRLREEPDALPIQQGPLGGGSRTRHFDDGIQRFDRLASGSHLPQMVERQVPCRPEQEGTGMRDSLFAGCAGDACILSCARSAAVSSQRTSFASQRINTG